MGRALGDTSDRLQAESARLDDRERIGKLFEKHGGQVWRVLRRMGVRHADLDDMVQEVFITAHRRLVSFEGRSSLKGWLFGICLHSAANYRRKAVHRVERLEAEPGDVPLVTGERDTLLRRRLDEAVGRLSDAQREVFVLYEFAELEMHEVAAAVSAPTKTCFSRLYAARKALRTDLEAQEVVP